MFVPAFVSDCLETLEEIKIRGKEIFMGAGGESFEMIPCLNQHPSVWVEAMAGYDSLIETNYLVVEIPKNIH